jgi:hypothetical protein
MTKKYSDIKFEKIDDSFKHNIDGDFACFTLWANARPYRDRIRELLQERFEILLETEIVWSKKNFHDNAERLYETPILANELKRKNRRSVHANKIGDNKFILFVIRDTDSYYTFAKSASEKIELSNLNVVNAKYEIRNWIRKDLAVNFAVHSTNSIYEFFFQAPLFLGPELFEKILNGKKQFCNKIEKDLEGANGWESYEEVFQILNLTSNYLVQRSFETLPYKNEEKDIDLLTDNYQRLASALGARQFKKQPYKGYVLIDNEKVSLDIRFVGDKYYDTSWQKDMLRYKKCIDGVQVPREDMYFFSLLFHCKAQKGSVKEKYIGILENIADNLNITWYNTSLLFDDKAVGKILKGYFQSQGYYYQEPVDYGVYKNNKVIKYLPKEIAVTPKKPRFLRLKAFLKEILPSKVIFLLRKAINKRNGVDDFDRTQELSPDQ